MSCCVLCLTTAGVPLFIKNKDKSNFFNLPFSMIGSLSGAHIFAAHHEAALLSSSTNSANIVWKVFHNSITMIALSSDHNNSDVHLYRLLENIFQCLVLLIGLDDLINIKNVERLKRELKCTYKMITCLLEESQFMGDMCGCVDVMLVNDVDPLQHALDSYVEHAADSIYGCILISNKTAVASKKWWSLTGQELMLISLLINTLPDVSSRDIPVFLPHGSPTVPHRLLTFQLVPGVEVCLLCGPTPTLAHLQSQVINYWRPVYESIRSAASVHPRNIPQYIPLDYNILGLLIINTELSRCVCISNPDAGLSDGSHHCNDTEVKSLLRSYYKSVVGRLFHPQLYPYKPPEPTDEMCRRMKHYVLESYMCGLRHKYYCLQTSSHHIFILYHSNIPTFVMRNISKKTLERLTTGKSVHI